MEKEKATEILNRQIDCYKTDGEECLTLGTCSHCEHNVTREELIEAMQMAISALEKQEQNRWHSVAKEGNPKKSGLYIVTDKSKMDGNKPHTRWFNVRSDESFWSGWGADEVIAWRPLPEPYREEEA